MSRWAKRPGKPATLTVIADVTEESIIDHIDAAAHRSAFVIVDLEGTASMMVGYAISRADLVIIPTQGSQLDAAEAVKAIKLVRNMEKARNSQAIPSAILFTRTSAAIRPRTLQAIEAEFSQNGVPTFKTSMNERDAFRAIFAFGGSLSDLDRSQVSNVQAAVTNARAFATEVVSMLPRTSAAKTRQAETV